MIRRFRFYLLIGGLLAVVVLAVLGAIDFASRYEPAFYSKALETDPKTLEKGSDAMLQQTAALASAVQKPGRWKAQFTAEQINGWLAVDLAKNHPKALPPVLTDPRVAIQQKRLTLACRYEHGGTKHVVSLTIEPYLAKPNVIAVRIVNGRAGLLPVPLQRVLDGLAQAAKEMQLHLEWQRDGADPVALFSLPDDEDPDRVIRVEALSVEDGRIVIAGATEQKKS